MTHRAKIRPNLVTLIVGVKKSLGKVQKRDSAFRSGNVEFSWHVIIRIARWFIFKPKNPILSKFLEGLRLEIADTVYVHLEYFTDIRNIL
jgi:hypothetical protein